MLPRPTPGRLVLLLSCSLMAAGCADSQPPRSSHEYGGLPPSTEKEIKTLGTAWENEFALAQAVKSGGLVFLSGQLSIDDKGVIIGKGNLEAQMRQAYLNVRKVLELFNLTMNDVLEETIYVTNMLPALTVGPPVRREAYGGNPAVASTLVQVQRLAYAEALVQIRVVARAATVGPPTRSERRDDGPRGGRGGMRHGGGMAPY